MTSAFSTPEMGELCQCEHTAMHHHHRGIGMNKGRCLVTRCQCDRFIFEDGTKPPLDALEINPRVYTPPKHIIDPLQEEIDMAMHMWITDKDGTKQALCQDPAAKPADKTNPLTKKAPICRKCFVIQSDVMNKKIARLEKELEEAKTEIHEYRTKF